jgi:RNA-binding protein
MSTLPQTDLKMLKQAAHHLKPIILIGSKGLSEAVHKEIERALFDHELIKIKVSAAERDDRDAMIDEIAAKHQALVIQRVGHTVTVYRRNEQKG